ncbi:MAG: transcription-repair coupling factor [Gammaproteobacteria bacterium]|nr:transcription-repair coupling factor [Gammaproteobacteria bacterium]
MIPEQRARAASPFAPPLPAAPGERLQWAGVADALGSLAIASAARAHAGPVLVVTADALGAARLEQELRFFSGSGLDLLAFPDWETLPYDVFSPLPEIVSQRLSTLCALRDLRRGVLVVPVTTLMQRLCPPGFLDAYAIALATGDRLDIGATRRRLEQAGYQCVSQVMAHGEFAVRGALLDLFPMGADAPLRIDLLDDEIDSIRTFDPETQRTTDRVDAVRSLPAREFPVDPAGVQRFRTQFRTAFEGDPQRATIYRDVSAGHLPGGIEYYLPLFFDATATLFDYLPAGTLVVHPLDAGAHADAFHAQVLERYEQRRHDIERPLLPPDRLYLGTQELLAALKTRAAVALDGGVAERRRGYAGSAVFEPRSFPDLTMHPRTAEPAKALDDFLAGGPGRVLFVAESPGRREMLAATLQGLGHRPTPVAGWQAFLDGSEPLAITTAPVERGVWLAEPAVVVLPEALLLGERVQQQRRRRRAATDPDLVVRNLAELHVGAPVVHEAHGVGRYLGLQTLEVGGQKVEFLALEYDRGDKLYVPVASLHLISRYAGASPETAPLHRLGGDQWERIRRKAAERARDAAAELLDIYARREARQGFAFPPPGEDYAQFAAAFPFEETPDQQTAIDAVLADMQRVRPMDRVVCGDVGFGKTEVAMRAAFVAAMAGRQVAVLVPTTLLAQQHYQNFADRFADWPVRIESLSRFRSAKEAAKLTTALAAGEVDIVIGTHRLLGEDVRFKALGLVIVDEEHRFGVRQKERLKALRSEVDILTLTATPIPRTLNMAMAGLRDLSIIATPPAERHPIKTFVSQWNEALIREAFQRELKRGGQIYYLHNEVESIETKARQVESLAPGARVQVAHGQMRERDLEQIMRDFYHQRFNVLVCTTIIESGIDVPSANTIIIDRADKLGLAQLHQLRGRVGRSHHRAYAYLVTPPPAAMTPDAVKRLEAIESLEDLGAGFALATHDLEIRGAGELLGEEQSGQIQEVGFSLYIELLERAVQALKAGRLPELDGPLHHGAEVDLQIPALLPEDYLPDVHARLIQYKRVASARDAGELRELQVEMIDRFGLLPEAAKHLFTVTELKLAAQPLGIRKIEAGPKGGRLLFQPEPAIDPLRVIRLIQSKPKEFKLDGGDKLRFSADLAMPEARIGYVGALLATLSGAAH